jgi:hypothetical protein
LKDARILWDSNPTLYKAWLETVIRNFEPPSPEEDLVFVNAWNEWGEAAYLEPSQRWGRAFLEATAAALVDAGANEIEVDIGTLVSNRDVKQKSRVVRAGDLSVDTNLRHEILGTLSGEEIGNWISVRTLIKALIFKLASKPGFKWLHRFRVHGKILVDGPSRAPRRGWEHKTGGDAVQIEDHEKPT